MNDVTLRPAVDGDASAVARIWYLGWLDGHLGNVSEELSRVRTEDSFRKRAGQRIGDTTVAVVVGQVAGFIMVVGDELEQMYVSRDHRGLGVADVLIGEAERQIGEAGHRTAWLAVVAGNARARRFYERSGWSDKGLFAYRAGSERGAITVPSHRYEKQVAPVDIDK